jgi:hypothetical protein
LKGPSDSFIGIRRTIASSEYTEGLLHPEYTEERFIETRRRTASSEYTEGLLHPKYTEGLLHPKYTEGLLHSRNTPKALANVSPGFEAKREPWVSYLHFVSTLKGFGGWRTLSGL